MDYTALNEVTKSIIDVIQAAVDPTNNVKVLPELLRNENNGVGFYLFHIQENSHFKNYPPPGKDDPPVSYNPMALNLFYQLSANWQEGESKDAYEEQKLMSVAMKALHDHAVIKNSSTGKKIDLKITLQTLTPGESVQYWAAAESPVRLSAYYEVSVVFLEPEKPTSYAGRVLSYGNFIFVQGAPQITGSQSIIQYQLPGEVQFRQVKIQPAQVPPAGVVSFFGSGFSAGTPELLLISPLWDKPAGTDAAWLVNRISESRLDMTVQTTAVLRGTATVVDVIPGLYAAQVSMTEQRSLPDGTVKTFTHVSNQFPFSVMPRITGIVPGLGGIYSVTGDVFQHTDIKSGDIQVYIGETRLALTAAAVPAAGEFKITGIHTMDFNVPSGIHGPDIPLRVMIRGIESEPKWILIP